MTPEIAKSIIQFVARQLGFDDCRIATAHRAAHADVYLDWISEGNAGDMHWLEKNTQRRCDPREVLPGCRSIVCLALNYLPSKRTSQHRLSDRTLLLE